MQVIVPPYPQTRGTSAAVCEAWAQLWVSCCKEKGTSHVTLIMTYIKDLSLCKSQKEAETKNVTFPLSVDV